MNRAGVVSPQPQAGGQHRVDTWFARPREPTGRKPPSRRRTTRPCVSSTTEVRKRLRPTVSLGKKTLVVVAGTSSGGSSSCFADGRSHPVRPPLRYRSPPRINGTTDEESNILNARRIHALITAPVVEADQFTTAKLLDEKGTLPRDDYATTVYAAQGLDRRKAAPLPLDPSYDQNSLYRGASAREDRRPSYSMLPP